MDSELDDLVERLEHELTAQDGALERIQLLRANPRHIAVGICPDCFIHHGFEIEMSHCIDSNTGIDIFECGKCWYHREVDYKSG